MSASLAHSPRPLTIGTPASSVLGMLLTVLAALSQRLRMRRDLHDLLSLDDAALHDIGLSRGGIEHAVRHGLARPRPARPPPAAPAPEQACLRRRGPSGGEPRPGYTPDLRSTEPARLESARRAESEPKFKANRSRPPEDSMRRGQAIVRGAASSRMTAWNCGPLKHVPDAGVSWPQVDSACGEFRDSQPLRMPLSAAEEELWRLVQRYTGRVGYRRAVKDEGLKACPPVIDCSGWVGFLLRRAMQVANAAAGRTVVALDDIAALQGWSEKIITEIERRTGFVITGAALRGRELPRCATVGLRLGTPAGLANHPRPRGITHIAQVVRRPEDDAPFVSEAIGSGLPPGIRLLPLADWFAAMEQRVPPDGFWAVDPFQLGAPNTQRGRSLDD
jgi:uncharacterized protein YjiS (DUF1127 family)